ncbi:MAG: cell division protein ZapA [Candidatus Omnitrophica bacterium]|nr:cell division protein ZapA [Candidatus Omnitrophota bacterium]MCM8828062.1 cell division protein ZapA [Candidatus Omnitrophota bacterium]
MKRYTITVLGRKCNIATEKDDSFMKKVESKINSDLKNLQMSMPHADMIDLFVVYLLLLYEKIDVLETRQEKIKKSGNDARKIIANLEAEIARELTNLTRGNKL